MSTRELVPQMSRLLAHRLRSQYQVDFQLVALGASTLTKEPVLGLIWV